MASEKGIRAGKAFVEVFADSTKLVRGLRAAERQVKAFGRKVQDIGKSMMQLGAMAAIPLAIASRTFAGFDDQMRAVQGVLGATGDEFAALTEQAKLLGRTTSFTAGQVAAGMLELARAGFGASEIQASIAGVLDLSRATGTELAQATNIAANTMRQMNLEATDMGRIVDVLTATANNSAQTLTDLGESMTYAAPVADEFGLTLEQLAKSLGALANYGIKGSQAGTTLKQIMLQLAKADVRKTLKEALDVDATDIQGNLRNLSDILKEMAPGLQKMGSADRLAILDQLFGKRAIAGGVKLTAANFEKLDQAIDNAAGTAARTAADMDSGIGGTLRRLWSAVEGVAIAIGEGLAPTLSKWADQLGEVAATLTSTIERNAEMIVTVLKVTAAVIAFGAAALIIGKVTAAVGTLIGVVRGLTVAFTFLLAHPVVAALAGIAVAATAVGLAIRAAHTHTVALSNAMQDQVAAGDMIRRNDKQRLQQLQQLAAKGKLNNEELRRATDILGQLNGRYSDLGITVNSATGAIAGMANAQERLNAAMRKAAAMDIDNAIGELRGNIIKLREEAGSIAVKFLDRGVDPENPFQPRNDVEKWFSETLPWGDLNELNEYKELLKQIEALERKMAPLEIRREALLQDDVGAVTGEGRGPAGPAEEKEKELGNAEDIAKARKDWAKKLHELRMQHIDDEFERERTQILERYGKALLDEKNFGAADVIMKARDTELAGVDRRKAKAEAEEAKKAANEAERLRTAIEQGNQARRERVEELNLRRRFEGLDLEQKMLDLEEKRALLSAKVAGERLDLVKQEYDLRRQILEAAGGAQEATAQAARSGVMQTMSASALNRMGIGAGSSTDQKMLEKLDRIAEETRQMNERMADMAVFGGPTFA
jgi:TP901 family phage tail tape measure protein